jgi:epoxyqueuosine reductase QueG
MNRKPNLQTELNIFLAESPLNRIAAHTALSENLIGLQLFTSAAVKIADANDPYFLELKKPEIVGAHHKHPREWLPDAERVICYMLYYSEDVRESNRRDTQRPSDAWLHGRIEGHEMVLAAAAHIEAILKKAGWAAFSPQLDARTAESPPRFSSFWSERHVAFLAGMGTFGLSKGLISQQGMAGRLGSVITNAVLKPDIRPYTDIYEYCSNCGACTQRCPANAISLETGKNHERCAAFIDRIMKEECRPPYYGCGKCQVGVPCETSPPRRPV